jgi:eukaryotic-like serine/threonine-protein kinase
MTPEQWQRVKYLFEAALDHSQADRVAFLTEACPEDDTVRDEVQSLLSAHDRDTEFMSRPLGNLIPDDKPILVTGQRLANYQVLAQLGKGGMGEVYLALDLRLERKVALKLLPSAYTNDADHVRRLEQEARAASALNHPNIVTIHEIGEADSLHFMATEFVEGVTLRQRMVNTQLDVREIIDISLQVASALRAAHEAGIVHRDMKPENIMLRSDGVVKVLDFGLAKLTETGDGETRRDGAKSPPSTLSSRQPVSLSITSPGVIMGTVTYMSPEQARGAPVDARTDVWSLGVILYEMVSREAPFAGETHREVIASILQNDLPPLGNDIPREVKQIIARALTKDPAARYENAGEMANDLKSLKEELEILARLDRRSGSEDENKETGARRIGFDTERVSAALTAGSRRTSRNVKDLFWQNRIFAGATLILLTGALLWAYFATDRGASNQTSATKKSIAVLPLKPVNSSVRDQIYEVGIADAVIRRISELNGFVVRQLTATSQYTEIAQDPIIAGKEQQVDYVLDSSYRLENGKIHVDATLVNIASGQIEAKYSVQGVTADGLGMQDAIASEIGNKLLTQFATSSTRRTRRRGTTNEEAYRFYLQGMYLANNRNLEDARNAVAALEHAVSLDPNYARAWAGLAYARRTLSLYRDLSTHEAYQNSMEAVTKALALDENLSEAHSALCENKYLYEWDFTGAEVECKRAIELDLDSAQAHEIYSRFLMGRERHDEAINEIKVAIDLDPTLKFNQRNLGRAFFYARRYKEAESQLKRVVAMDPNWSATYGWLWSTLALQGKEAEAFEWMLKFLSVRKADEKTVQIFKTAFQTSGWHGAMREWLKVFDKFGGINFDGALYNAQIGEKDKAFEYLEKVYQGREIWNTYLRVEPRLDPLRDDPRFDEQIRRVESK